MNHFILTFIGDDRPGYVNEIAEVIKQHQGNWLESRMVKLGGKFAGLARIAAPAEAIGNLKQALAELAQDQFTLGIEDLEEAELNKNLKYELDILGNDKQGIIQEISLALAEHDINLIEVSSNVSPAPMTGIPMFSCTALVEVSPDADLDAVDEQLMKIADDLGLEIRLEIR
ncbi:MAG: ACT domain-containing protein [Pseudomonadales bacterium]|jgi:glycine cleavage system regulatory protein